MNPITILSALLPLATQIISLIEQIKNEDPAAWAAVSEDWNDTAAKWRVLNE